MRKLIWWGRFLLLLVLSLTLVGPVGAQSSGVQPSGTPPSGTQPSGTPPAGMKTPVVRPLVDRSALTKPPVTKPPVTKPPATKPPVKQAPAAKAPVGFTDYESCLGEFRAAGAFKFYDNTEAILRLANFEQALMRYRFLKGQIQGKAEYYGLMASVNRRIQFLKKQLHLRDTEVAAIPPRKARMIKAKPAVKLPETLPPEKPEAAKPKTSGEASKEVVKTPVIPGAAAPPPSPPAQIPAAAPLPTAQKPPPVVTTDAQPKEVGKAKEEEQAKEEKEIEKPKPKVPPSFWQRLKLRLNLGKKQDSVTIE